MPKKFQTYKCNVCKRKIDKEFAPIYSFIHKCNITYKCLGILEKIGEKNVSSLQATFQSGVENWRPRGQTLFVNPEVIVDKVVPLSTSNKRSITIGIDADHAQNFDKLKLKVVQIKDKSLTFNNFQYRVTYTQLPGYSVYGTDSFGNSLSFSLVDDAVFVFVNGEQLTSTDYVLSQNTVGFNIPIQAYSIINLIIKEKSEETERLLSFTSNSGLQNFFPGAWSNVNTINCPITLMDGRVVNKLYKLYTLDDPNELGFNVQLQANFKSDDESIYLFNSTGGSSLLMSLSGNPYSVIGLFSERQFTVKDRILTSYFNLSDIRGTLGFLNFKKVEKYYEWTVSDYSITSTKFLIDVMSYVVQNGIIQYDGIITDYYNSNEYETSLGLTSDLIVNP